MKPIKGGSCYTRASDSRSANRIVYPPLPGGALDGLGFRLIAKRRMG